MTIIYMSIEDFKNKVFKKVYVGKDIENEDILIFIDLQGNKYKMFHERDCCENVVLEDINGDLKDLIGNPILLAEVVVKEEERIVDCSHTTWTFYKIGTIKGTVTIRWTGNSNGWYSEEVTIAEEHPG